MRLIPTIVLTLAATGLAACGEDKKAEIKTPTPPTVLVQKVAFVAGSHDQTFSATIQPRIVSDHAFRVTGKVVQRFVNVGDKVTQGEALAELDSGDLKLQLSQAEAEMGAAGKALKQQSTEQARVAKLTAQGWDAPAALEKQNVVVDEAKARLDKAKQSVELAQNTIGYAILKSNSDGVVTETSIEAGQVAAAGQKVISVAKDGEIEALVAIPENIVADLANAEVNLSIWSDPSVHYSAKLRELAPQADAATRTFAAKYSIEQPDQKLKLGMSAQLHLASFEKPSAIVPLAAILDQGKGPNVWSVNQQTGEITLKPVKILSYTGSSVLIGDGLTAGEFVVALGAQKLDAGLKVRAVETLEQ